MSSELRLLLLEDVPTDAELELRELRKAGLTFTARRVDSREAFIEALADFKPGVILADFHLPSFDGLAALALAHEQCPQVPFIFVSGLMGEEVAVESLKQGATDYILKDRLSRLAPAVTRALAAAEEHKQTEGLQAQLAAIVESSSEAIIGMDLQGAITSWNHGAEDIYGYPAQEVLGRSIDRLSAPAHPHGMQELIQEIRHGRRVRRHEAVHATRDGAILDVSLSLAPVFDPAGTLSGISAVALDVSEQKRAERALVKKNRAMKTLSHCNETLVRASEHQQLLNDMCRIIVSTGGYRMAWVGLCGPEAGSALRFTAQSGCEETPAAPEPRFAERAETLESLASAALATGEVQILQDAVSNRVSGRWPLEASIPHLGAAVSYPLKGKSGMLGVLSIYGSEPNAFDGDELQLLGELADDLAFGISTLRMRAAHQANTEKLERSMQNTIQAIANIVEIRDPYTAGHQRRVAELARAIACELGLPDEQVRGLHLAGIVHDIGKIQIPAEILSKPGRLTEVEFRFIQIHSQAGYEILKDVEFPWPIADIVAQHHERINGTGYPKGLKGDEILLEAKILSVADVVEAMASHRPYRPGLGIEAALAEITQQQGVFFEPEVVAACLTLFRERGYALETSSSFAPPKDTQPLRPMAR